MANQWIPIIKGIMVATAILLTPILVLFIPTPLVGKALSAIAGFFVWLAFWGVIDAALHKAAMDQAYKAFEEVRSYQLGLVAVSNFGTASLKALAQFAAMRWTGLMISTFLTGMLIKIRRPCPCYDGQQLKRTDTGAGDICRYVHTDTRRSCRAVKKAMGSDADGNNGESLQLPGYL